MAISDVYNGLTSSRSMDEGANNIIIAVRNIGSSFIKFFIGWSVYAFAKPTDLSSEKCQLNTFYTMSQAVLQI
jgi:hypothetical protein